MILERKKKSEGSINMRFVKITCPVCGKKALNVQEAESESKLLFVHSVDFLRGMEDTCCIAEKYKYLR